MMNLWYGTRTRTSMKAKYAVLRRYEYSYGIGVEGFITKVR